MDSKATVIYLVIVDGDSVFTASYSAYSERGEKGGNLFKVGEYIGAKSAKMPRYIIYLFFCEMIRCHNDWFHCWVNIHKFVDDRSIEGCLLS